jgi:NitT/TauT family transport system substrate-binding protein
MRFGRLGRAAVAVLAVVLVATGCSGSETTEDSAVREPLEQTELRVGVLPVIDNAPLFIALQKGYFADEGLKVTPEIVQGAGPAIPKLLQGSLDIAFTNYVSVFAAQAKGTGKFHVLTDGYQAKPKVLGIVVMGDKLAGPKSLEGRTIAVNALQDVGTLTISSALSSNDVKANSVKYRQIPFPQMAAALAKGQVDAAWMEEPFITSAAQTLGARLLLDTASGPTADFPVAGYVSTSAFVESNPRTAAAFRRAMQRAQQLAADRQNVEKVLPEYSKVDPETAVITSVGVFPTSEEPSPVRLQRVADLMQQFGMLSARLDVKNLTE